VEKKEEGNKHWYYIRTKDSKERARKAKKRGGFDFSYIDKKYIKDANDNFYFCKWCGQVMYVHTLDRIKGEILMSCDNPKCVGNAELSDTWRRAKLKQMGFDPDRMLGPQKIITKHRTNQNWIDEKGYVY